MYLLLIILAIISYQDLKSRAISWWTIPMLLGSIIYLRLQEQTWEQLAIESILNIGFLTLQFFLISLYFSVKERKLINIADVYLGWGDILFLLPVAFLFSTVNFIIFYISSIIVVLLAFVFYKNLINQKIETIPLAGGQAIYLFLLFIFSKVFDFNMLNYLSPLL